MRLEVRPVVSFGTERIEDVFRTMSDISIYSFIVGGIAIFVSAVSHVCVIRKITNPLTKMAKTALCTVRTRGRARFAPKSNVTEILETAEALNRLYGSLDERNDELAELLDMLMHDIKTPLSAIRGEASDIVYGDADPKELAFRIMAKCDAITSIINKDAELTRNTTRLGLSPAVPVDAAEIIRQAVEMYSYSAEAKDIKLSCAISPNSIICTGHKAKYQSVFANLISNAVKYTPEGGKIDVLAIAHDGMLEFVVTDNGIGIPTDELDHVFERSFRSSGAKREDGSGIGLALVAAIVDLYGGTKSVKSAPGEGTTFTIRLPLAKGSGTPV